MKKFIDPEFRAHESLAWLVAEAALQLASLTKLPLDVRELASVIEDGVDGLRATLVGQKDILPHSLSKLLM